jgi:predicted TIM-barrel enzyme
MELELLFSSFKKRISNMPVEMQIELAQKLSETGKAILVTMANGPKSIREISRALQHLQEGTTTFENVHASRKSVSEEIRILCKIGLIEGPRRGRGGKCFLSAKIIPFLFSSEIEPFLFQIFAEK